MSGEVEPLSTPPIGAQTDVAASVCWTIRFKPLPGFDPDSGITLFDTEANVYYFEAGVVVQTRPTGIGSYYDERVIPWSEVMDYREERVDV